MPERIVSSDESVAFLDAFMLSKEYGAGRLDAWVARSGRVEA